MTARAGSGRDRRDPEPAGPGSTAWSPSTPPAGTRAPTCSADAFGDVVAAPGATSFPRAVALGLEHAGDAEWVWILHDDANPDPGALAAAARRADRATPAPTILGPKLREWPSLRRLLELGITISGTGRRETGLERGEYDQGQHDEVREVLAVNTAGMLVRRTVLKSSAASTRSCRSSATTSTSAGARPRPVTHPRRAAGRGLPRRGRAPRHPAHPLTGRHTHYQERRAALYTLLANSPAAPLPFQSSGWRSAPCSGWSASCWSARSGRRSTSWPPWSRSTPARGDLAARRTRRASQRRDSDEVRRLLAPRWLPYRHGLDFVGDLAAAATNQAADVAERRRGAGEGRRGAGVGRGVRPRGEDDDQSMTTDPGSWPASSPTRSPWSSAVRVLRWSAPATRSAPVSGGALSPVPAAAADWWRWHRYLAPLGQGTPVPPRPTCSRWRSSEPPRHARAAAIPRCWCWPSRSPPGRLAGCRRSRRLGPGAARGSWRGRRLPTLVPVVSGAWGEGRFGVVPSAALLPWLAHAALGFADPEPDRRWRAAWRRPSRPRPSRPSPRPCSLRAWSSSSSRPAS